MHRNGGDNIFVSLLVSLVRSLTENVKGKAVKVKVHCIVCGTNQYCLWILELYQLLKQLSCNCVCVNISDICYFPYVDSPDPD